MQRLSAVALIALFVLLAAVSTPACCDAAFSVGPQLTLDHGFSYRNALVSTGPTSLARDGDDYIATFEDDRPYVYRYSRDGRLIDRRPLRTYYPNGSGMFWAFSDFDGRDWKVLLGGRRSGGRPEEVAWLGVLPLDHKTFDQNAEWLAVGRERARAPAITWTGRVHLVTWIEGDSTSSDLWFDRVSPQLVKLTRDPIRVSTGGVIGNYGVAAEGGQGWFTWMSPEGDVWARRFDQHAERLEEPVLVAHARTSDRPCAGVELVADRAVIVWSAEGKLRAATVGGGIGAPIEVAKGADGTGFALAASESSLAVTYRVGAPELPQPMIALIRVHQDGRLEVPTDARALDPARDYPAASDWTASRDTDCLWVGDRFVVVWDYVPPGLVVPLGQGGSARGCGEFTEEPPLMRTLREDGTFLDDRALKLDAAWEVDRTLTYWNGERFVALMDDAFDRGFMHAMEIDRDGVSASVRRTGSAGPRDGPCLSVSASPRSIAAQDRGAYTLRSLRTRAWEDRSEAQQLILEGVNEHGERLSVSSLGVASTGEYAVDWTVAAAGAHPFIAYTWGSPGATRFLYWTFPGGSQRFWAVRSQDSLFGPTAISIGPRVLVIWGEASSQTSRLVFALADSTDTTSPDVEGEALDSRAGIFSNPRLVASPDGGALALFTRRSSPRGAMDIEGLRFDPLGQKLDSVGFSIGRVSELKGTPQGVWDGGSYVVCWVSYTTVYAQRVSVDGGPLGPALEVPGIRGGLDCVSSDGGGRVALSFKDHVVLLIDDETPLSQPVSPLVEECMHGVCLRWRGWTDADSTIAIRAEVAREGALPVPPNGYSLVPGAGTVGGVGPHELLDAGVVDGACYAYASARIRGGEPRAYSSPVRVCYATGAVGPALSIVPNPSSAHVSLRYSGARPGSRVTFDLFDAAGRRVRRLETEARAYGVASLLWDERDADGHLVPAGLYWIRAFGSWGARNTRLVVVR